MERRERVKSSLPWYQDRLGLVMILAGCLDQKDLARHGRKAGLWPAGTPSDRARLLSDVHEACPDDPGLRKSIAKQISRRFPNLLTAVRTSDPEGIDDLELEIDRPQYLLWACLTDQREEMRGRGRVLAHDLIKTAVKDVCPDPGESPVPENYEDLYQRHQDLARENSSLRTKLERVRDQLKLQREYNAETQSRIISSVGNLGQQREIRALRSEVIRLQEELAKRGGFDQGQSCLCRESRIITPQDFGGLGPDCPHCNRNIPCRDCPLQGRRVAVIGGLDRMESIYRQVVEKLGGEFEFHCGRVKDGCQSVQGLISRSDYIIYITTINSHASMRATKTICKKNCKRFIALKERGAGSLERRLREVSRG